MGAAGTTFTASNTTDGLIGSDTLINIELIKLTTGNDSVTLANATGNLSLTGGGGADTITTGSGNDFIDASNSTGSQRAYLSGNAGNDTLIGGAGPDSLLGGAGDDSLVGNARSDTINGGDGFDTVGYSDYTQSVQATATDSKTFALGVDGGALNERLINIEALIGGSGNDRFDMTDVTDAPVKLSLVGNGGNDTFKSGAGADTLSGGTGNDLYYVNNDTDNVIEGDTSANGNDTVYASGSVFNLNTNGANVEQLYHRNYDNSYATSAFTGTGNTLDNLIAGGTGNDQLYGGGGNDTFLWTGGNDTIDGEGVAGHTNTGTNDQVDFSRVGTNSDSADLRDANRIEATENSDGNWLVRILNEAGALFSSVSLSNIENIIGKSGKDVFKLSEGTRGITIGGNGGDDLLSYQALGSGTNVSIKLNGANAGSAVLNGTSNRTDRFNGIENIIAGAGDDTLVGDNNANVFIGREGNDLLDGGVGIDTADYSYITAGTNGITVQLNGVTAAAVSGVNGDQDTLANIENIIGTVRNDRIFGDGNANSIFGGDGNDTLSGGAGSDILDGGGNAVGSSDMVDFTYVGAGKNLSIGRNDDGSWTSSVEGSTDVDTLRNFEAIKLGNGTNLVNLSGITYGVTVDGSLGGSNSIATGTGADSILGGGGNDSIIGNGALAGGDTMDGGAGTDLVSYNFLGANAWSGYRLSLSVLANSDGTASTKWVAKLIKPNGEIVATDQLDNFEQIKGGQGDDFYDIGNLDPSSLTGFAVNDTQGINTIRQGKFTTIDFTSSDTEYFNKISFFDGFGGIEYTGSENFIYVGSTSNTKPHTVTGSTGHDSIVGGITDCP